MKKTTVRDYDAEGNLVRETITEDSATYGVPVNCTCRCATGATIAYCPAHGYIGTPNPQIWCGTSSGSATYPSLYTTTTYAPSLS